MPVQPTPANDSAAPVDEGANKREHERKTLGLNATAFEHLDGEIPKEGLPCEVFDISRSGLGVRCRKMMYAGRKIFVRLNAAQGQVRMFFGEVRYSRYTERGLYHIGVMLVPLDTSPGRLQDWIDEQTTGKRRR